MTQTRIPRLHLVYGIVLAVFTVIVGALFIAQAADIYFGGEGYSRELVIEHCSEIAVPFWLWVAAVAAGGILWLIFLPKKPKLKAHIEPRNTLSRLVGMAGTGESEIYLAAAAAVKKEKKIRAIVWIACLAVCLVCAGIAAAFLFDLPAYPDDPNEAILRLVRSALPCIAVAFLSLIGATVFDAVSAKRVLPQARILLREGGRIPPAEKQPSRFAAVLASPWTLLAVRLAVLIAAVLLIAFGIAGGGMNDVFLKAVNICTECIGLG